MLFQIRIDCTYMKRLAYRPFNCIMVRIYLEFNKITRTQFVYIFA